MNTTSAGDAIAGWLRPLRPGIHDSLFRAAGKHHASSGDNGVIPAPRPEPGSVPTTAPMSV